MNLRFMDRALSHWFAAISESQSEPTLLEIALAWQRVERRDMMNSVKSARHFVVPNCVTAYGTISAKQNDLRNRGA